MKNKKKIWFGGNKDVSLEKPKEPKIGDRFRVIRDCVYYKKSFPRT